MEEQLSNIPAPTFMTMLEQRWHENTLVCVGLDPVYERIPAKIIQNASLEDAFVGKTITSPLPAHKIASSLSLNG